ncbi:MAG TPA: chorismate mutase [Bacillota bacterium]|nr:chorismate mutase [Bacillota bacterium]
MQKTVVRGIRGAINIYENTKEAIGEATKALLEQLIRENQLASEDIVSIFFTVTEDVNQAFPAVSARELGLVFVPLLCSMEISVPGSMPMVIRVLVHVNTTKTQREIRHIYLRDTVRLRPDIPTPPNAEV